ncbi:MAG: hypothetical protein GY838_16560 [bacterium]|nr:hypothetical protein [bacterium]
MTSNADTFSSRREWLLAAVAGLPPLVLGAIVHRQGFNLLDDGLWVLGARTMAEGGVLYRDLFAIYGPGKFLLLIPLFPFFGISALSLAMLKAVCDGTASLLAFRGARSLGGGRWAWLVPVAVMALGPLYPRYVALVALTLVMGAVVRRGEGGRWFWAGVLWGAVALFGIDAAAYGFVVVAGSMAAALPGRVWIWHGPSIGRLLGGVAVVLVPAVLLFAIRGAAGDAWWDTVVYPLTRFQDAMGMKWWETFASAPELGRPFSFLMTGESLAGIWSGHGTATTVTVRALFVGFGLVPPLAGWLAWRSGKLAAWGPWIALAVTGWMTMGGRGGATHLKIAWLRILVLVVILVAGLAAARLRKGARYGLAAAALVFLTLCWGTLLAEKAWLATHADREGLVHWERPGARMLMDATLVGVVDEIVTGLTPGGPAPASPDDPLLSWPLAPGLHVVLDRPLATSQATLLAGEVRDPARVIAELEASRPPAVVLGNARGIVEGVLTLNQLAPELWDWLRDHYVIADMVRRGGHEFTTCAHAPGGRAAILQRPLHQRLPDVELRAINDILPLDAPGAVVGQTFTVGGSDLAGLVLRLAMGGDQPVEVPVRVRLRTTSSAGDGPAPTNFDHYDRPLGEIVSTVRLEGDLTYAEFPFAPMAGTAGRHLLLTVEILEPTAWIVGVGSHLHENGARAVDFHPGGTAFANGRPVAGDIYLLTY